MLVLSFRPKKEKKFPSLVIQDSSFRCLHFIIMWLWYIYMCVCIKDHGYFPPVFSFHLYVFKGWEAAWRYDLFDLLGKWYSLCFRLVFSYGREDILGRHDAPVRCIEYSYATGWCWRSLLSYICCSCCFWTTITQFFAIFLSFIGELMGALLSAKMKAFWLNKKGMHFGSVRYTHKCIWYDRAILAVVI